MSSGCNPVPDPFYLLFLRYIVVKVSLLRVTHLNDDEDKYMIDLLFVNNQFFMADREGFEPSEDGSHPL